MDSNELRRLLFDAAGDPDRLAGLCSEHRDEVVRHFGDWVRVPPELRSVPEAMRRYAAGLIGVARAFAERLGEPALLKRLAGPPETNPLARCEEALRSARTKLNDMRYEEAIQMVEEQIAELGKLEGPGVDAYLPIALECLGEARFHQADAAGAVEPFERALTAFERADDAEGEIAALGALFEIHRWLGDGSRAADRADALAARLRAQGRVAEADRYGRRAKIAREGEPLNRVVAIVGERPYELDEVPREQGQVRFVFERNRVALKPSTAATAAGERLAGEGRLAQALEAFRTAAAADRHNPHPHYLAGLALLDLGRPGEAVAEYETTERLAPGWFHCRADGWLAREMAAGRVTRETFRALQLVEEGGSSAQAKLALCEQTLATAGDLAPLHLAHGRQLAALGRGDQARAALRRGLACAVEPDVRSRILVELAVGLDPGSERDRLLHEALAEDGNLVAAAMARVVLFRANPN